MSKLAQEMAKASKESVDYSKGMPAAHCAICRHFQPPNACKVVAGRIDPSMWCEKFARAK